MTAPSHGVIVLDCDGVILDSNSMKTEAFAAVLAAWPSQVVEEFLRFQKANFGRSRYLLFEDFFAKFSDRPAREDEVQMMIDAFAREVSTRYLSVPETLDASAAIAELAKRAPLYVVSGSDQAELVQVFKSRGLDAHFKDILGSPSSKIHNLQAVANRHSTERLIFVGDSNADLEAATAVGTEFVFMSPWSSDAARVREAATAAGWPEIDNLGRLLRPPFRPE